MKERVFTHQKKVVKMSFSNCRAWALRLKVSKQLHTNHSKEDQEDPCDQDNNEKLGAITNNIEKEFCECCGETNETWQTSSLWVRTGGGGGGEVRNNEWKREEW